MFFQIGLVVFLVLVVWQLVVIGNALSCIRDRLGEMVDLERAKTPLNV